MRFVCRLSVVALNFRGRRAAMPSSCMIFATVFSETTSPARRSCSWTRGLPYVPRERSWTALTLSWRSSRFF